MGTGGAEAVTGFGLGTCCPVFENVMDSVNGVVYFFSLSSVRKTGFEDLHDLHWDDGTNGKELAYVTMNHIIVRALQCLTISKVLLHGVVNCKSGCPSQIRLNASQMENRTFPSCRPD